MAVRVNWRGDQVLKQTRKRAAKILELVAENIVHNVQDQLYPGHGELSGDLKKSYGFGVNRDDVNFQDRAKVADIIANNLRLYVGSTWAYAFRIDQGFGDFEGYNQLSLALDETTGDIKWVIKQVRATDV